jgi:hypothetical protein
MNQFADWENGKAKLETGNSKIADHKSPITNDSMTRWLNDPMANHSPAPS